ncbi:hypothetical protein HMPREF9370_1726 [Neisseria wadsworthii 9715]|uniref:Uncharacterized protein n=1 Tax=Neisseria wadsworthii 9715 TaxID=1030841 RepID=G4CRL6_9NEIS|nr:hypothetical protein HMPREF9370_1726 [Neisseria wadsworthii 9715]
MLKTTRPFEKEHKIVTKYTLVISIPHKQNACLKSFQTGIVHTAHQSLFTATQTPTQVSRHKQT